MASIRRQILEALRARVVLIRKPNGFITNAGNLVLLGEQPALSPNDQDTAIAFIVDQQEFSDDVFQGDEGPAEDMASPLQVRIVAIVKADLANPLLAMEDVIHDIKKAVELPDRTLGGLVAGMLRGTTTAQDREEGSEIVGASQAYIFLYTEVWGNPEANP